jgi:hypothetical protein
MDAEEFAKTPITHTIRMIKGDVSASIRASTGPVTKMTNMERSRLDKQLQKDPVCDRIYRSSN